MAELPRQLHGRVAEDVPRVVEIAVDIRPDQKGHGHRRDRLAGDVEDREAEIMDAGDLQAGHLLEALQTDHVEPSREVCRRHEVAGAGAGAGEHRRPVRGRLEGEEHASGRREIGVAPRPRLDEVARILERLDLNEDKRLAVVEDRQVQRLPRLDRGGAHDRQGEAGHSAGRWVPVGDLEKFGGEREAVAARVEADELPPLQAIEHAEDLADRAAHRLGELGA